MMELPSSPISEQPRFDIVEVHMFDACTLKCGYCWFAESGRVLDLPQLDRFRDPEFIDRATAFFNKRTTADRKWLFTLTGGEPLIAPNLDRFGSALHKAGNRISYYTGLMLGKQHPGFQFVLKHPYPETAYVMASFHPESEKDEAGYFERIRMLKERGHKVFVRMVGHPDRLHRLDEISDKCRELDVCFYPTTLFSPSYPQAYTAAQRDALSRHYSSLSQWILMENGVDTKASKCYAGSRLIALNLQTGNLSPCISTGNTTIGNIFEDRLDLHDGPMACPEAGTTCACDVHFQNHIVIGADDRANFVRQGNGFVEPRDLLPEVEAAKKAGIEFTGAGEPPIGRIADETKLFFTAQEVRQSYQKSGPLPVPPWRSQVRSESKPPASAPEPVPKPPHRAPLEASLSKRAQKPSLTERLLSRLSFR